MMVMNLLAINISNERSNMDCSILLILFLRLISWYVANEQSVAVCDDFISMSKIDSKVNHNGSKQKKLLRVRVMESISKGSLRFSQGVLYIQGLHRRISTHPLEVRWRITFGRRDGTGLRRGRRRR